MKRSASWLAAVLLFASTAQASTAGYWLPATDIGLRQDIQLLVDEGVIRLPVTTWPLAVEDVRRAVRRQHENDIQEYGLQAALLRVRDAVAAPADREDWNLRELVVRAGEQGVLRDYGTLGRENMEVTSSGGAGTDRWAVNIRATAALSPQDNRNFRLDGSYLSVRAGNWILSAGALERWWGPGQDGSLILSTNARPVPHFSVDRAESIPFSTPLLRWLGPWTFSAFVGALENRRPDLDRARFLGMRLVFQPLPILEFGVSRTAQFCGQNAAGTRRACSLGQVGRVLIGRDNAGYLGTDPSNEPGNQMAGFDMRLTSPVRRLPLALYAQMIGEDTSNQGRTPLPNRYLGLMGLEAWTYRSSGSIVRARVEYANTNCKWYAPAANFRNCAYRQSLFGAGYRYRTRNIGHTTDADAESIGLGVGLQRANGEQWGLRVRRALLDRYGGTDPFNPLTQGPGEYRSAEVSWRGAVLGQDLSMQLGYETHDPGQRTSERGPFGFLQWRKAL